MTKPVYDVLTIGNAIVDVIAQTDDSFLTANSLTKGSMTLIDTDRAVELYNAMPPAREVSGGSAANTAAGIAGLGGSVAYIGKVRDDQLGAVFRHDMRAAGCDYDVPLADDGPPTARSLIVVTPDAERTMNTYLGISSLLAPSDIDYVNAHGTATAVNDINETRAIKRVFGNAANKLSISSTKSMHGHCLGAGGGIEAVAAINAMEDNFVPPTVGLDEPDPECDLDYTPNAGKERDVSYSMSNSFAFGGLNAVLVFGPDPT